MARTEGIRQVVPIPPAIMAFGTLFHARTPGEGTIRPARPAEPRPTPLPRPRDCGGETLPPAPISAICPGRAAA